MYNSSGYGSICKKNNHQPGSLLYSPVLGRNKVYTQHQISPQLPSLFEGKLTHLFAPPAARYVPLSGTPAPGATGANNRFDPNPPQTSLAYRYDGVNPEAPNAYTEFNSKCQGTYTPKYAVGQRKLGPQGCTSCKSPPVREDYRAVPQIDMSLYTDDDDGELFPVLDPKFNLREVAKHMILLEDHLFQRGRRCNDCISKHRLTLEAFIEEAITLDKTGEYRKLCNDLLKSFKKIMKQFVNDARQAADVDRVYCETAQKLRELRKPLCVAYSDFC